MTNTQNVTELQPRMTREQLIERVKHHKATAEIFAEDAVKSVSAKMDLMIFEIALASLEAEPVAKCPHQWSFGGLNKLQRQKQCVKCGRVELAAQPAPVSVPYEVLKRLLPDAEKSEFWFEHDGKILFEGVKFNNAVFYACRAAMLQGAEPVTTANKLPFEQWLSQQTGTIDVECGCVMTEVFFHWLRVAYEAGNSPVIPDGWVLVPVEPTMSQEFAGYRTLTDTGKMSRLMKTRLSNIYRAMIAAAPQQEVKP